MHANYSIYNLSNVNVHIISVCKECQYKWLAALLNKAMHIYKSMQYIKYAIH